MRVVGLMSGTSYDGIDAAVADLTLDGEALRLRPLGSRSMPFSPDLQQSIDAVMPPRQTTAADVCRLDTQLGQAFADAAARALAELGDGTADLVVSHGQTIFHWVEGRRVHGTLQLGQPAWIAERTGLPVLADLRARDVAAGGQGAPLVSMFDVLLLGRRPAQPRAALNLGGIANITVVGPDRDPVAFDTGPANALMDAAMRWLTDGTETFDADGRRAARGRVDGRLLAHLLDDEYYGLAAPKTTGKERFHGPYLLAALDAVGEPDADDLLATLSELTARTVAAEVRSLGAVEVVAAGGGTRNPELMRRLAQALAPTRLTRIDDLGIPAGAKESYAFAMLGFLSLHGHPGIVASCTGASRATILGSLVPGRDGFPTVERPRGDLSRLVVDRPSA